MVSYDFISYHIVCYDLIFAVDGAVSKKGNVIRERTFIMIFDFENDIQKHIANNEKNNINKQSSTMKVCIERTSDDFLCFLSHAYHHFHVNIMFVILYDIMRCYII